MMKLIIFIFFIFLTCGRAFPIDCAVYADILKWSKAEGASGYFIYYGQQETQLNLKHDAKNVTEFKLADLPYFDIQFPWYMAVSAYNFWGESSKSTIIRWSLYAKSVKLFWDRSDESDILKYQVAWRKDGESYDWSSPIYEGLDLRCETPSLYPGITYYFGIRAVDKAGNASPVVEVSHSIIATPEAPNDPDIENPYSGVVTVLDE